jgi:hypothetical protein
VERAYTAPLPRVGAAPRRRRRLPHPAPVAHRPQVPTTRRVIPYQDGSHHEARDGTAIPTHTPAVLILDPVALRGVLEHGNERRILLDHVAGGRAEVLECLVVGRNGES